MTVDVVALPDSTAVTVLLDEDDLEAGAEHALHDRLSAALDGHPSCLVVDLVRCRWVDAPGVRVLAEAAARAAEQGCAVSVLHASPEARRLLELAADGVLQPG